MSTEHGTQNRIRNALAGLLPLFRANVGRGWTGSKVFRPSGPMAVSVNRGDVVIYGARPFDTGLPVGFSDTFGVLPVVITQDMVGKTIGRAVFGEVKDVGGKLSPKQTEFLSAMKRMGAAAEVWRSPDDALATIARAKEMK
jgi:hypothetical protein